jgi:hypothetical protein
MPDNNKQAVKLFKDPAGLYTGPYTSDVMYTHNQGGGQYHQGSIQIEITTGTLTVEGRVNSDAPWVTLAVYTIDSIDQLALVPEMRVITTLASRAWLAEHR